MDPIEEPKEPQPILTGSPPPPARWAIVEIMGHRVVAGRIAWGEVPYDRGVAVDVPLADGAFLREFYGGGAIFSVRLVPETLARREAEQSWHVQSAARALLPAAPMEHERPGSREALYRAIDERLEDYDPLMLPETPEEWEGRITERLEILTEARQEQEQPSPAVYRSTLVRLAAEVVAAIETHDRVQAEDIPL